MKQLFTLLILLVFGLTASAQLTYHTMTVGGTTRNYYKYLPSNYQSSEHLPVVFILHGLGGNATQMTLGGFGPIADTARIIAIYPNATLNSFGQTAWNNGTFASSSADDITFFNKMMDKMIWEQNANPNRIYVTGFSMGGIMSHHLACAINDRIAAIGPMAGTMSTDDIANCIPTYKTPVIHLHGTVDATVPYAGTALPSLSLVAQTMDFWRNVHGCSATADSTQLPDTAPDGITVDRFVYNNCNPLGSVELWRLNGADHVYLAEPLNDITEAKEIWRFFNKWQHPNPALALDEMDTENQWIVYPNPNNGGFDIRSKENKEIFLFAMDGTKLATIQLNVGENKLNFDLSAGVYLLSDSNGNSQRLLIK
jgi:polyhydroxybutyrate depolymerase